MKTFVKKSTYEKVMAMERTKHRKPHAPRVFDSDFDSDLIHV